jgi:hypothetical protein
VQVSTCLFDAYEDYNCFGDVTFLVVSVEGFKMEKAAIKFYVK